jgi:glutamate formiminotransferase
LSKLAEKLIESVINISEGQRPEVVASLAEIFRAGARLLDYSADYCHNRSVFTLVGDADALLETVFAAVSYAAANIDLRRHQGEHPRIGAVDVIPFIPLGGTRMTDCIDLARRLGERIGQELAIPVYLYQEAATRQERCNLSEVRRGQFEGLAAKMARPAWQPDFGPAEPHPSFGAVAIGARFFLVAYNINLAVNDVDQAKRIAKKIREADGGLAKVKALGFLVDGRAQVSINLTDYRQTGLLEVYRAVEQEAARLGIEIANSELIGLLPQRAILDVAAAALALPGLTKEQILEHWLD